MLTLSASLHVRPPGVASTHLSILFMWLFSCPSLLGGWKFTSEDSSDNATSSELDQLVYSDGMGSSNLRRAQITDLSYYSEEGKQPAPLEFQRHESHWF